MRWLEKGLIQSIQRYLVAGNGVAVRGGDVARFLKSEPEPETPTVPERVSLAKRIWSRLRRG